MIVVVVERAQLNAWPSENEFRQLPQHEAEQRRRKGGSNKRVARLRLPKTRKLPGRIGVCAGHEGVPKTKLIRVVCAYIQIAVSVKRIED